MRTNFKSLSLFGTILATSSVLLLALNSPSNPESVSLSLLHELISLYPERADRCYPSIVSEQDVLHFLEKTVIQAKDQLLDDTQWVNGNAPHTATFFDTESKSEFKPYMHKVIVPTESTLFIWGDIHGCAHSFIRTLRDLQGQGYLNDDFTLAQPNTYLVFLGDCVDRGRYGLEVLYIIMRLKCANPGHVVLIRGNHEDQSLNVQGGFKAELEYKQFKETDRLYRFYDMWPPVAYIGSGSEENRSYIMCCHGGLEIGANPTPLIAASDDITLMAIKTLDRADAINELPEVLQEAVIKIVPARARCNCGIQTPTYPVPLGYMWNDFLIEDPDGELEYLNGRGWKYGQNLTKHILDRDGGSDHRIKAIMRGHQHYGVMQEELVKHKGNVSLWEGLVYTVLSAPAIKGDPLFNYDSCTKITTAPEFKDWTMVHMANPIP